MKRSERKIYCRCIAVMAAYIISATWFYTCPVSAKNVPCEDFGGAVDNFTAEDAKIDLRGVFDENSAMPCCDREAFERWYAEYERKTSEEESTVAESHETEEVESLQENTTEVPHTEIESAVETDSERVVTLYEVDGIMPDPALQQMLYEALDRHGISYWYELAWVQCYQESKWNVYAVNPNNLIDSGILQFRSLYWDWSRGDLFSPQAQFDLYSEQMANRLNQGLSADECISRHKTSDYCPTVDWGYVQEVKQHLPNLRKVEL